MNKYLLLLLIVTTHTFSQNDPDKDPKAKIILDELSKTTKTYSTITTEYSLVIYDKNKKKVEEQTGKAELKKEKFKLEIPGNNIVCDGKTIWNFNKDAKELTIKNYQPTNDDQITPNNFFTIYENGYKYKLDNDESVGKVKCHVVNLYPAVKPEKKKYHTIKLYIDIKKKQIIQSKVLMKSGEVYIYLVKKFQPNLNIADNTFTYDTKDLKPDQITDERD